MKVIYVSGPINGIENHNCDEFLRVANDLRFKGYTVINPHEIPAKGEGWSDYMRADIIELMKADTIAMLKEWDSSAGARIEVSIACSLGMNIVDAYTLKPIALEVEVIIKQRIQAGDTVYHTPCDEKWGVLGVNYARGELCVGGWPPTIAKIKDCTLIEKGNGITEEELAHRNRRFGSGWDK